MATKSSDSTSSPKPPSYSYWADPSTKHLWQAARDKLAAGEPLAPQRMIPVVVSTPYESKLLKLIAGLVECPEIDTVGRLSTDEKETGEIVLICLLSDQVISRLEGYIEDSEEYLVSLNGKPRYAYKFRGNAQVAITSEEAMKTAEPVRVLSLDGINDYFQAEQQLQILNNLMSNGTIRPRDVFELIGGVGISGLVSILLGHPYDFDLNKPLMSSVEGQKIFVKANVRNRQDEILLRTYYGDDPQLISEKISILDAIRSTMAAFGPPMPAQFSSSQSRKDSVYKGPFELQSLPQRPDTEWNNPIYDVYREARSIWPDRDIVIVSIGVGRVPLHRIIGSEEVVSQFKMNHPDMGKDNLFRFQPVGNAKLPNALFIQCAKRLLRYESLSAFGTVSEEDVGGGLFETDRERTALADETGKEKDLEE